MRIIGSKPVDSLILLRLCTDLSFVKLAKKNKAEMAIYPIFHYFIYKFCIIYKLRYATLHH